MAKEPKPSVVPQGKVPELMPVIENPGAKIVVVCDAPGVDLWKAGTPIGGKYFDLFSGEAIKAGFGREDFGFISPCGPMPGICDGSDKREKEWIDQFRDALLETIEHDFPEAKLFVILGKTAGYALTGKPMKIMKQRGIPKGYDNLPKPVLPMLSPGHVLRRPEMRELFEADFNMLRILADNGWSIEGLAINVGETKYEWRDDISDILANPPKAISFDAEATGLRWYKFPEVRPLTFQMSFEEGTAICSAIDEEYREKHGFPALGRRGLAKLRNQWKQLLENPDVKKCGHNMKIDHHFASSLGIKVRGWQLDTQLLCFMVDENMQEKSQDECVRRWVPEMAGYADEFNQNPIHVGKTRMIDVPPDLMLEYGGGDADANLRLAKRLAKLAMADKRNWNCYKRVIYPAMRGFMDVVEPYGILIDTDALAALQITLDAQARSEYAELIKEVPAAIRRKHAEKGLEFSRPDFVRDILFTPEGFGLTPKVFTASTQKLPDDQKLASTSTKEHLPYFDDNPFVVRLMKYQKLDKLNNTYVGKPGSMTTHRASGAPIIVPPTGFWQYIHDGRIHPSFMLHRTVTGRTASADPNGQNFPKRGELAKAYRKIFVPTPGYKFCEHDLSQIELRLVAWTANERNMLKIYAGGGDIHASTAMAIRDLTEEQWAKLDDETKELYRYYAKSVNFGFIYGLGWKNFIGYAKANYNLNVSEKEAQKFRNGFFKKYPGLLGWHGAMREFVREHGYVRALHGAIRHLPNIRSFDEGIRSECERQAINSPIQRFASDLGIMALGRMCRDADPELVRPVAFIHDALVTEIREDYLQEGAAAVKFYMESNPLENWFGISAPMPILSDAAYGDNLSEMVKMKTLQSVAPPWYDYRADGYNTNPYALAA